MECDSGLGIQVELPGFPTVWFQFSGGGFVSCLPAFSRAVGTPFGNHRPDLLAVIASQAECQTPGILDGLMSAPDPFPPLRVGGCGERGQTVAFWS